MPLTNDKPNRVPDPQITVRAHIKEAKNTGSELLIFTIPIGPFFEIVCICNIPGDGEMESDVYCKFKMGRPRSTRPNDAAHRPLEESRDVRHDDFDNGDE